MNKTALLKNIAYIDREIKYYKKVYPGDTNKIFTLLNKRKYYSRKLNNYQYKNIR